MKFQKLYELIIDIAMKHDPRSAKVVKGILTANKKAYSSLKGRKKSSYDKDALFNPYYDTRILYGDRERDIKTIMVGVDMETPELLLADRFNQMSSPVDLVMTHHPGGRALVELHKVMELQTDRLKSLGVTPAIADEMMNERMKEVARRLNTRNCMRNIDAAKLLDIPYMCAHTAADNMVNAYLERLVSKKRPKTLGALVDQLSAISEYKEAAKYAMGPEILVGDRKSPIGKIFVDMTGGTEGSKRAFGRLSQAGVGTIICMHLSEEHYKEAKKERINIVIAGHMSSDSLGINLLLDELLKKEDMSIIPCSGFTRYSRI